MSKASELIDQVIEVKLATPDHAVWMKKAAKFGGKKVGLEGRWLSYEFKTTSGAKRAADLAADLGLQNQWQDDIVQIKLP